MNEQSNATEQLVECGQLSNIEQFIKITQLPIIKERLEALSPIIDQRVNDAVSLACTEENYKTVKAVRADLNKESAELEEQRKAVKTAIMQPYNEFEATYKSYIADKYKAADTALAAKISGVENDIKGRKADEVEAYFNEHCDAVGLNFIPFERTGIKVTMSSSMKSLKDQAKNFIDRIMGEIEMISTQDYADEIMVEYKKSLNSANAITTVVQRHKAMEAEAARRMEADQTNEVLEAAAEKVEPLMPPVEAPAPDEKENLLCVTFSVTGTIDQLKALKKFLDDGGYRYE